MKILREAIDTHRFMNELALTWEAHTLFATCTSHPTRNETHAMPKHPPAPIHIRIDTQEQRSGIPDLLAAMPQVLLEVTPLHMGDYDVGGFNHSTIL